MEKQDMIFIGVNVKLLPLSVNFFFTVFLASLIVLNNKIYPKLKVKYQIGRWKKNVRKWVKEGDKS